MVPDPAKQKQRKPKCLSMAGVKKDLSLSYTHKKDLVFPECGFWPTRSGFRPEDCILRSSRGIWMEAAGLLSVLWAGSPQSKECQKHSKTVGTGYVWRLWSRRTSPKCAQGTSQPDLDLNANWPFSPGPTEERWLSHGGSDLWDIKSTVTKTGRSENMQTK